MASTRDESTPRVRGIWRYLAETGSEKTPDDLSVRGLAQLALRVGTLLGLFVFLEWWLPQVSRLTSGSYERESILVELITLRWTQLFVVLLAGTCLALVRPLWLPWSAIEQGRFVRALVCLAAGILAWTYSTYDFNLYFGRAHLLDRILVVMLAFSVIWRPVFVLPFLLILLAVVGQFSYSVPLNPLAEESLLIQLLVFFLAAFLVQILSGSRKVDDFLFCVLILVGSYYFRCGLAKSMMGWIAHGHLYYLMFSTYANGWLGFLEPSTVTSVAEAISRFDWPMRVVTLAVECGALVLLWRRGMLLMLLGGWMMLHCGIFALSGIFFWKWILLDAALLAFFIGGERSRALSIFTRPRFVLSVVLIAGGFLWSRPQSLSWFDVPVCYTLRFEALGEKSGQRYHLPPRFFAPYDFQFTLGRFRYLVDEPQPRIVWGAVSDRDLASALLEVGSAEEIWALEKEKGRNDYDEAKAATFDRFISKFVVNFNSRGTKRAWWDHLQPPRQIWTFPKEVPFVRGERVRKVIVVQVTTFYDGERYSEIRRREIREIEIPR